MNSPMVPGPGLVTKIFDPGYGDSLGVGQARDEQAALTVAPDVVYSPIVPLPKSTTNRSDPEMARPFGGI